MSDKTNEFREDRTGDTFIKKGNGIKFRQGTNRGLYLAIILLSLLCIALVIAIIAISVKNEKDDQQQQQQQQEMKTCGGTSTGHTIDLSESENPSIFHDLTTTEIKGLMDFIYADTTLNLVPPKDAKIENSYMYSADLYLPDKNEVLNYLDSSPKPAKPQRAAVVTVFRGDQNPPIIEEYKVSPLPNPDTKTLLRSVPFNFRPATGPEYLGTIFMLTYGGYTQAKDLLLESFGGSLWECGDKCLVFRLASPMGSATTGDDVRKTWYWLCQFSEFYPLHPVDFAVLVASHGKDLVIEKVRYNSHYFDSIDELVKNYTNGDVPKLKVEFPVANDESFSKLQQRGTLFPKSSQRPPIQVEPDGKRYTVVGQEIQYMNWNFHFRMSNTQGPQLYNILYQGERIVYELGLQEIVVFYSDSEPTHMFANYFDSYAMLGQQSRGLVLGADCPSHATLMDTLLVNEGSKEPATYKNAFCVFEQNTGEPLRRHHSFSKFHGRFYEGAPNSVLILRSIATIVNYDYIFDFIFYQNGAIQVKVMATGYILSTPYTPTIAKKYGFQVHDRILGNMHHHSFNFKVDLDIKGTNNRYEMLEILNDAIPNPFSKVPNAQWHQEKVGRKLVSTEKEAAYKFDFDLPMDHIFYNEGVKDKYGNQKAYRLLSKGMSKSILPEGSGNEPSGAWMRYQMAVTKQKEAERQSSSKYAMFDSINPTVNFQAFIDDNDTIVDQDLVTWVTLGIHHVPHTEDLPVTHTPGIDLSFYLLPYNYFPEDPSMATRDSIRIELKDPAKPANGIKVEGYTDANNLDCVPEKNTYFETIEENPTIVLDTEE